MYVDIMSSNGFAYELNLVMTKLGLKCSISCLLFVRLYMNKYNITKLIMIL